MNTHTHTGAEPPPRISRDELFQDFFKRPTHGVRDLLPRYDGDPGELSDRLVAAIGKQDSATKRAFVSLVVLWLGRHEGLPTLMDAMQDDEARVFVLADADAVGDELMKLVEGNNYLFRDIVIWLAKDEAPVTPVVTEEDVKIVHKKEDDSLIFYGTTFGLPALVMLAGVVANRRRRRS